MTPEEYAVRVVRKTTSHGTANTALFESIIAAIREAVAEEREACAQTAERYQGTSHMGTWLASQIRARS